MSEVTESLGSTAVGIQGPERSTLVPLVIRGEVITDSLVTHSMRRGGGNFQTPDVSRFRDRLVLEEPILLGDLYSISFEEILEYLDELGRHLHLTENAYLQEAFEVSASTSGLPRSVLEGIYTNMHAGFDPVRIRAIADHAIGVDHLEGWVRTRLADGADFSVRAFGVRSVHLIAGNLPSAAASTIVRNAITRGDAIIKSPSNDPATAAAIARTMCDLAPDHPLTRHVSVAYWKGGDTQVEDAIYRPSGIEKIVAWGGEASMRHIRGRLGPGIDLLALDPKLSSTFIGRNALTTDDALQQTANRLARDIGGLNQEGCVNARVVYVESGTDPAGIETVKRLGELTFAAVQALPASFSAPADAIDPELLMAIETARLTDDWFHVVGGADRSWNEGAIVVSLEDEPADFSALLSGRVANLVPVDDLERALRSVTAYTQTVGVYPADLKARLRDRMARCGVQRIVTLGHAVDFHLATPQDGLEPLRRLCKWVVDEEHDDPGPIEPGPQRGEEQPS